MTEMDQSPQVDRKGVRAIMREPTYQERIEKKRIK